MSAPRPSDLPLSEAARITDPSDEEAPRWLLPALATLFFCSGLSALVYQVLLSLIHI